MDCPKCPHGKLAPMVVDGVEVDRCAECQGIWFDQTELGSLLDRAPSDVAPLLGGKDEAGLDYERGKCPRCGKQLLRVKSVRNPAVTLDACSACRGIWLDAGEFQRIQQAQPGIRLGEIV